MYPSAWIRKNLTRVLQQFFKVFRFEMNMTASMIGSKDWPSSHRRHHHHQKNRNRFYSKISQNLISRRILGSENSHSFVSPWSSRSAATFEPDDILPDNNWAVDSLILSYDSYLSFQWQRQKSTEVAFALPTQPSWVWFWHLTAGKNSITSLMAVGAWKGTSRKRKCIS